MNFLLRYIYWLRSICFILMLSGISLVGISGLAVAQDSEDALQLLYLQRAPFSFDVDQQPQGILVDIMAEVSSRQDIAVSFKEASSWLSVLKVLKSEINACSLGAYKTEQRARTYKYSASIFQEAPYVVVANRKLEQFYGTSVDLDTLLASDFVFGVQKGFSYGRYVDNKMLLSHTPRLALSYLTTKRETYSERHVFSLINLGRVDYVLLNADEYQWNLAYGIAEMDNITALTLDDELTGNNRYLMCSKAVSDSSIQALNEGLIQLKASGLYQQLIEKYKH